MKKLVIGIFLLGLSPLLKADSFIAPIGPSTATINSTAFNNSSVTILSPGAGQRNCLTDFQVTVSTNSTISIKDGTSDIYVIDLTPTNIFTSVSASLPFDVEWVVDPLCAGINSRLQIVNSTGTAKINYKGQIRGR